MGCNKPWYKTYDYGRMAKEGTGKVRWKMLGQSLQLPDIAHIRKVYGDENIETNGCHVCVGCRTDYVRSWAIRSHLESTMFDNNWFITLTYDNDHLPFNSSIYYPHVQTFFKDLRYHADKGQMFIDMKSDGTFTATDKFYYYGSAEYGTQRGRPHYHALVFNLPLDGLSTWRTGKNPLWRAPKLEQVWKRGMVIVGRVEYGSAAYVASYMFDKEKGSGKKLYVPYDDNTVFDYNTGELMKKIAPERSFSSKGVGKLWFSKYWKDVYPSDTVVVNGREYKPPRYFDDLMKKKFSLAEGQDLGLGFTWEDIASKRLDFMQNAGRLSQDRLDAREQYAISRVNKLLKELE